MEVLCCLSLCILVILNLYVKHTGYFLGVYLDSLPWEQESGRAFTSFYIFVFIFIMQFSVDQTACHNFFASALMIIFLFFLKNLLVLTIKFKWYGILEVLFLSQPRKKKLSFSLVRKLFLLFFSFP